VVWDGALWEKSLLGLLMLIMAMLAGIVYLVEGIVMCPHPFLPLPLGSFLVVKPLPIFWLALTAFADVVFLHGGMASEISW
jgi:hypothetical protein